MTGDCQPVTLAFSRQPVMPTNEKVRGTYTGNPFMDDFFLFVACDGYRALFSGREIFTTPDGEAMLIVDRLNGDTPTEGMMLAPTADYFSDRAMWGLAHVVRIPKDIIDTNETSH